MIPLEHALRTATARLAEAGVDSPRVDAEELAAHVLAVRRGQLLLRNALDEAQADRFDGLVAERARRVPLQHLVGRAGFRHLELEVGLGVFVPRPETESVVQWAVDALARVRAEEGVTAPLVVDLCAGSGTIALALANEVPGAVVHAVERSPEAMHWTKRNVDIRTDAGDPEVTLHLADAADALPELDGTVDLVASNPPYVAVTETHIPDPEVLDHDPGVALWAGEDGLDVVRVVEATARRLLRPSGLVVVEHSDRQGESAPALFRDGGGWADVADHRDLAGRDRFVTARWTGSGSP
jgi:release factor glutamine methyltransferase